MKIIKRSGAEVVYDRNKIACAIRKANEQVIEAKRLTDAQIESIVDDIEIECHSSGHALNVEDIQDLVENGIMQNDAFDVAKLYITYRYRHQLMRKENTTDQQIMSLLEENNEEVKQENSNKNPTVVSVQRDYMAGEVSKDITRRFLLDPDISKAHDEGIIHFHDADYFAQHMHNCDLVNLEDMLQNGTVISGTKIDRPHSFSTACNIATQIIAQVASCQYGGQSITLAHLAPFVDVSRKKITQETTEMIQKTGLNVTTEQFNYMVDQRVKDEIKRGVQTIQYQVITLMTTNGQAPFVTVFMYLNEAKNEQEKEDLALIIEEVLKQRYQGVKNEKGAWITPA
ncbi:anaerobic ribonucleoside-triphosphate reductase, partial [Treponema sp.]|uniref:anaerobic ribonucleoside-triphosphate reductase n=1 Tax=Treponema sp. TaxID=166 RepID=UPI00298DE279